MAVTIDIGDPTDVHPRRKREVGHRLALLARALAYGEEIESSGPRLNMVSVAGQQLQLRFSHATGGLTINGQEEPNGFEVAASDERFVPATVRIEGKELFVFNPKVAEPVAVRYGFTPNPRCNLTNGAQLPASPFEARVNP